MARPLKDINIEIGARIKQHRKMQNLSREGLAELSGYSSNFIQEVERGRSGLSSESIRALSVALKTSADSLILEVMQKISHTLQDCLPQCQSINASTLSGLSRRP